MPSSWQGPLFSCFSVSNLPLLTLDGKLLKSGRCHSFIHHRLWCVIMCPSSSFFMELSAGIALDHQFLNPSHLFPLFHSLIDCSVELLLLPAIIQSQLNNHNKALALFCMFKECAKTSNNNLQLGRVWEVGYFFIFFFPRKRSVRKQSNTFLFADISISAWLFCYIGNLSQPYCSGKWHYYIILRLMYVGVNGLHLYHTFLP